MKTYRVVWEIDIEADSPREAAIKALEIQRDPLSTATVFDVGEHVKGRACPIPHESEREEIDLLDEEDLNEVEKRPYTIFYGTKANPQYYTVLATSGDDAADQFHKQFNRTERIMAMKEGGV